MTTIDLIDTTLRDGQQSVWATRMPTSMMLPYVERLDRAGFTSIDLIAAVQFDAMVRFLRENPWERIRLIRRRVERTPLNAWVRSRSLVSFETVPDDIVEAWVDCLVEAGIRRLTVFDALHDPANLAVSLKRAKKHGIETVGALVYTVSPVHTDEFYLRSLDDLLRLGVDRVLLKDPGGLLTVDRVRELVPAIVSASTVPVELHTHCSTGLAPIVSLEAAQLGIRGIHTGIPPLAQGQAQPSVVSTLANLHSVGLDTDVDESILADISTDLLADALGRGLPQGTPVDYRHDHYEHQLPGGMLENLREQLRTFGMEDRLPELLTEVALVREELGYPVMVTPFSQLVATQAMINLTRGRYEQIPDAVCRYVLGHYGRLVAPVAAHVRDAVDKNLPAHVAREPQELDPALPGLRRMYPNAPLEELVLRFMFPGDHVDQMLAAGPVDECDSSTTQRPWQVLFDGLTRFADLNSVSIRKVN